MGWESECNYYFFLKKGVPITHTDATVTSTTMQAAMVNDAAAAVLSQRETQCECVALNSGMVECRQE